MKKINYTYDIVYNEYNKNYRVYEYCEERVYYHCIFVSSSRKECVEYIKNIKGKRRKNGKIQSRGQGCSKKGSKRQ